MEFGISIRRKGQKGRRTHVVSTANVGGVVSLTERSLVRNDGGEMIFGRGVGAMCRREALVDDNEREQGKARRTDSTSLLPGSRGLQKDTVTCRA
jgi:hypothetical protein